jgi:hypothetical protein
LATKSGGNQLHGSIFGYGRNQSLIATDYFSDPANGGQGKPPFSRAQYGGSLGGPLVQSRLWYFGAIERIAQTFSVVRSPSVYNELQTLTTALPNIHALNSHTIEQPSRDTFAQAKVNVQLNERHSGWLRYASEYAYVDNSELGNSRALLEYSPNLSDHNHQSMWNVAGGWSWVRSNTTVNQFTAQYISYTHDTHYPQCPLSPIYLGVNLGNGSCLPEKLSFPSVATGQLQTFPIGWLNLDNKLELKEDFSKQIGSHSFKVGGNYMFNPINGGTYGGGSPGSITFFDDPSVIVNNLNGRYPLGFRTPGIVRQLAVTSQTIGDFSSEPIAAAACQQNQVADCATNNWRSPLFNAGAYVQDDFRVSRRVTLNLGLRYDIYDYIGRKNLPNNRTYQVLQAIGSPYGKLPKIDKTNIQPRVGIAWDLAGDGKDVIRASYGMFYLQGIQATYFNRNYISKPILFLTQTITDSAVGVGPLANFVYGSTPLPAPPLAPAALPVGGRSSGQWYDPNFRNQRNQNYHAGWSHVFPHDTVVSADYMHVLGQFGWRNLDINPLINGVRPLSALTQAVYGDPNLLSTVIVGASVNRSLYDELGVHFEHRFAKGNAFQTNYTLAWGRGMGGVLEAAQTLAAPYPQIAGADGGNIDAPWEWAPTAIDERHRVVVAGLIMLPFGIEVSPAITLASPRAYTQYRATNPSGDGSLQLLCPSGDGNDVGFGVGQMPCGLNNARGHALYNANARVTKNLSMGNEKKLGLFAEFYNIFNHANFGNQYFGNQFSPATYGKPSGFIGGIGAISTLPNSFQVQLGTRFSF